MKRRMIAGVLCIVMALSASLSLSGCGLTAQAADLMDGVKADTINTEADLTGDDSKAVADFAVKLFQNSAPTEKNTLISPLSVLCALSMTANGAQGKTLEQMETVLGLPVDELNAYMHTYLKSLPSGDQYKVNIADSIWFKDDGNLTVNKSFLQTNADYYGAAVYKTAFDQKTLNDINAWVKSNTDGMIPEIISQIPDEAVMYLINALAFDAEWEDIYNKNEVRDGTFTTETGDIRNVEMMQGSDYRYLDDGSATGFIKYYADEKYAFAALLPNEGVSVADYVAALTGEGLINTLQNAESIKVNTVIPKFESDYSVEMSDILKSMGMTDAFDGGLADLSGIGTSKDGNLFINRVIHKTYIAVDEKGTKAGAATAVEVGTTSMPITQPKTVTLDRPFVYMIVDCETNLPIFIGTMLDVGQ